MWGIPGPKTKNCVYEHTTYFIKTLHKIYNSMIRQRRREALLMNMKKVFKPPDSNDGGHELKWL
jgi:hypothetical protein